MNWKGSGRKQLWSSQGTIPPFAWRGWGKPHCLGTQSLLVKTGNFILPNMKKNCSSIYPWTPIPVRGKGAFLKDTSLLGCNAVSDEWFLMFGRTGAFTFEHQACNLKAPRSFNTRSTRLTKSHIPEELDPQSHHCVKPQILRSAFCCITNLSCTVTILTTWSARAQPWFGSSCDRLAALPPGQ